MKALERSGAFSLFEHLIGRTALSDTRSRCIERMADARPLWIRCDTILLGMTHIERIRSVDYRLAVNAFIFTGLWFVIGAVLLWSPIPGSLGIDNEMFAVWLVLFFLAMAASGSLLTIASLNAVFPPGQQPPPSAQRAPAPRSAPPTMWAPGSPQAPPSPANPRRDG